MEHKLKTLPEFFKAVKDGSKTAEWRKNDRDFKVGDKILLQEYKPCSRCRGGHYTGAEFEVEITHALQGRHGIGIPAGYAVLSIKHIADANL